MWSVVLKLAVAWGPQVLATVRRIVVLVRDNPEQAESVLRWLLPLLQSGAGSAPSAVGRRLERVREVARQTRADGSTDAVEQDVATDWLRRADGIERALAIAEALEGTAGRRAHRDVRRRVDALATEVLAHTFERSSGVDLDHSVRDVEAEAVEGGDEAPRLTGSVAWTLDQLEDELDRWEHELLAAGQTRDVVDFQTGGTRRFLDALAEDGALR